MTELKNHLGLDKFQLTVIKSNYNSTKPIRKLIEKNQAKIGAAKEKAEKAVEVIMNKFKESAEGLVNENQAYQQQIEMLDKFSLETTKNACGIALTSEQVIEFLDNPEAFTAYKIEQQGVDMFEANTEETNTEVISLDAEEDKDWEDIINSGELKEAV